MKEEFRVIKQVMDILDDSGMKGFVCVVNDSVRMGTNMPKHLLNDAIRDINYSFDNESEIEFFSKDFDNLN